MSAPGISGKNLFLRDKKGERFYLLMTLGSKRCDLRKWGKQEDLGKPGFADAQAMADYLASQEMISFDYDAILDVVTTEGQKIGLASSGTVTIDRPGQIHATRSGGFADLEMVFDGKTFWAVSQQIATNQCLSRRAR